ncbi:unnamed protein product [Leuciscus chuanchicus]
MSTALNHRYQPPSRDDMSNTYMSNTYQHVELAQVSKIEITCDGWTSVAQDHYLTVTVHYIYKGSIQQKVLSTEAVYESQTGPVVAQEIHSILEEFKLTGKVIAATVDNAYNMDVALRNLKFKVYGIQAVTRWCAKIRAVVVWLKRSHHEQNCPEREAATPQ